MRLKDETEKRIEEAAHAYADKLDPDNWLSNFEGADLSEAFYRGALWYRANPAPTADDAWYVEASGDGQRDSRVVFGSKDQARRALADMMFFGTYEEAQKDEMVNAYLLEFDDEENHWANGVWEADGEQCWFRVSKIVEPVAARAQNPKRPAEDQVKKTAESVTSGDVSLMNESSTTADDAKLRDEFAERYMNSYVGITNPDGSEADPCLIDLQIACEKAWNAARAQTDARVQGLEKERDAYALAMKCALTEGVFPNKGEVMREIGEILKEFLEGRSD